MEKIFKAALSAKFGAENASALLTICQSTGNPQVAVEMALGCYQAPQLQNYVGDLLDEAKFSVMMTGLAPLERPDDVVHYKYFTPEYLGWGWTSKTDPQRYFATAEEATYLDMSEAVVMSQLGIENHTYFRTLWTQVRMYNTSKTELRKSSCSIDCWQRWSKEGIRPGQADRDIFVE